MLLMMSLHFFHSYKDSFVVSGYVIKIIAWMTNIFYIITGWMIILLSNIETQVISKELLIAELPSKINILKWFSTSKK